MNITTEEVERFRQIWWEEFDEEISEDEAKAHINRLDALYHLLSRRR